MVDDEKNVLYSGEQMLNLLGYEVLLAGDGEEAFKGYPYKWIWCRWSGKRDIAKGV